MIQIQSLADQHSTAGLMIRSINPGPEQIVMTTGIDPTHLRRYVIEPTLNHLALWNPKIKSEAAIRLLLGTAAHESKMGHYLHQNGGPALGIYQCEPFTHDDVWMWIEDKGKGIGSLYSWMQNLRCSAALAQDQEMEGNLYLSTGIARIAYWRHQEPLPDVDDIEGLASYAKRYWNTRDGKATVADYANAMREFEIA